jgi:hypothetical protein
MVIRSIAASSLNQIRATSSRSRCWPDMLSLIEISESHYFSTSFACEVVVTLERPRRSLLVAMDMDLIVPVLRCHEHVHQR